MLPAARRPDPSNAVMQSGACPGMIHTGATTLARPIERRTQSPFFEVHLLSQRRRDQ